MENTHTVYLNMCHHYRKILNAKPRVDTSLPKTLQMKENNNRWKPHREDSFIRMKTSISQENQKGRVVVNANTKQNTVPEICPYYYQRHFRKEFENARKPLEAPTILKNNSSAQSTARTSRAPLRKKRVQLALSDKSDSCQETEKRCKQHIKRADEDEIQVKPLKQTSVSSVNSYSEESSEDSAYNEGECNTDSRGSTPQNALNKHESKKQHPSIMNNKLISQNSRIAEEDFVCIQFLTDITNDILRKNIYTNTALRGVLQQHIKRNKYDLQMETMLSETMKLQERLGIPKDEKFDDDNFGLGGLNLLDDVKKLEYQDIGSASTLLALPPTVPKTENDLMTKDPPLSTTLPKTENDLISRYTNSPDDDDDPRNNEDQQSQNADYSDNFSGENSYSESSHHSEREACDGSINNSQSSVRVKDDETCSEVEEDVVEQIDDKSEKYSDVDESISHLEPDSSEISDES